MPHRLRDVDHLSLPAPTGQEAWLSLVASGRAETGGRLRRFVRRGETASELAPVALAQLDPLLVSLRDELEFGPVQRPRRLYELLHRAYRLLLADARPWLDGAHRLWVGADGLARYIPFHALVLEPPSTDRPAQQRRDRPLFAAQRWTISYLPCAALWSAPAAPPEQADLVLPGYGKRSALRLARGTGAEAAWVRRWFPSGSRYGPDVGRTAVLDALARPGSLVHFGGHGIADLAPGTAPELLLSRQRGSLSVATLAAHRARASLVVLASCTSGYAARFRDDRRLLASTNPAEALLGAGARAVVAASWGVKARESAEQLHVFYRHLRDSGPAAALATAYRRRIARIDPPHPRFWAVYAVYGTGRW